MEPAIVRWMDTELLQERSGIKFPAKSGYCYSVDAHIKRWDRISGQFGDQVSCSGTFRAWIDGGPEGHEVLSFNMNAVGIMKDILVNNVPGGADIDVRMRLRVSKTESKRSPVGYAWSVVVERVDDATVKQLPLFPGGAA